MTKNEFLEKLSDLDHVVQCNVSGPVGGTFGLICSHLRGVADESRSFTNDAWWNARRFKNFCQILIALADLPSGEGGRKFLCEPHWPFFSDLHKKAVEEWGFQS